MKEIMFKICELCGDTYHIDEMVTNENWCVYCEEAEGENDEAITVLVGNPRLRN